MSVPDPFVGSLADHSHGHGLCWSGIIAGAIATSALGIILLTLGFGLGLSAESPWAYKGVSGKAIAEGAIAWLVLSQIIASGMGGYLAGRLRHRWSRVHLDEIHFRDSAQGFLAWALSVVVTTAFLVSAGSAMIGGASARNAIPSQPTNVAPAAMSSQSQALSLPATANAESSGSVPLSSPLVSTATSSNQPPAADVEAARKAAAYSALWLFIALLTGAFSSSVLAIAGGRHRDTMFTYVDRTV